MTSKNKYIDNLKDLVDEYMTTNVQNQNRRSKRGVLNFVGQVSKILFGTLPQSEPKDTMNTFRKLKGDKRNSYTYRKDK
jgi:hypothetical protein